MILTALADTIRSTDVPEKRWMGRQVGSSAGLAVVLILSVGLMIVRLHQGYVSVDDPLLAHTAERTLNGERPHVDFHEGYTGGLSYLNALALLVFGIRLISLRYMLFVFFVAWVPAFWYISSRITSSLGASLITLLAVVWSVPIYPSPVGSWYSLYFATFALASAMRFIETRRVRWIFFAGLSTGFSFLAKISGLYLLAGLALFLLFDVQNEEISLTGVKRTRSSHIYAILITIAILAFDSALFFLVRSHLHAAEFYHFLLPGVALSVLLLVREWRNRDAPSIVSFRLIGTRLWPFALGFFAPVAVFLVPYACTGNLHKFFNGVFIQPMARVQFVYGSAIHPIAAVSCIPLFAIVLLETELKGLTSRRVIQGVLLLLLGVVFVFSIHHPSLARWTWISAATTIPLIVGIGVVILLAGHLGSKQASTFVLLLAVVAMCSLVEFPYFAPMYFCYVAPLAILAFAGLYLQASPHPRASLVLPFALFYLLFALFVVMPNRIYNQALSFESVAQEAFTLPRARGIVGPKFTVETTEQAVLLLQAHAAGAPIYSGPDSPEFYFLSGLKNCTPNLVEFASGADATPSAILGSIDRAGVKAVLLNHTPGNDSGPLPAELLTTLRERFPESTMVGRFEVRWRR